MSQKTVVVVDEDVETRAALCDALQSTGKFVAVAESSATAALQTVARVAPLAVIAHWRMVAADGVSFLRDIRTTFPQTARILITGASVGEIEEVLGEEQDLVVLPKPFDHEQVMSVLLKAMDARSVAT